MTDYQNKENWARKSHKKAKQLAVNRCIRTVTTIKSDYWNTQSNHNEFIGR